MKSREKMPKIKTSKQSESHPDLIPPVRMAGIFILLAVVIHGIFSLINTAMLKPQMQNQISESQIEISTELIKLRAVVKVNGREAWQSTKIFVEKGKTIQISVLEGEWTEWKNNRAYNSGAGSNYICSQSMNLENCVEPIPDFPSGALIGRIDRQVLNIGTDGKFLVEQSGILQLRINDADIGLHDNDGELIVEIIIFK